MGSRLKYPIPALTPIKALADAALAGAEYRYWYDWARSECRYAVQALSAEGDPITLKRFAELLALFSPRVSVLRSAKWAIHYTRTGKYMGDVTRHHKSAVVHYEHTGIVRGPKTEPFARALIGDSSAVVLDTWMGHALGVDAKRFEVRAVWNAGAVRLRETAAYLGWPAAETQAAIWAHTVRTERKTVPTFSLMPLIDGVPI